MLTVEVVSPERILYTGEATFVRCRTVGGGELAFLTGHAPFVGALDIGEVLVRDEAGAEERIAVHGGFVEVSDDRVTILSDVAELAGQIDVQRATEARTRAEEALRSGGDESAVTSATLALRRAELRLAVAGAPATATGAH
jgi:F-type H+-transporting ATPase subunit epsilon